VIEGLLIDHFSGSGVVLQSSGADTVQHNTIADNQGPGVRVDGINNNAIRQNNIYGNGSGVQLNDGANNNQAAPLITTADPSGSDLMVAGSVSGAPSTTFTLDFFANAPTLPGQGQLYFGSVSVPTDETGSASFTAHLPGLPAGTVAITATTTDANNNTSTFSTSVSADLSGHVTYAVLNTADSGIGSFRQALLDSNGHPNVGTSPDTIVFDIAPGGVQAIAPQSSFPTITDPVTIDGTTQPGFSGTPIIELDGTSAGVTAGLQITAGQSTVRGLAINEFSGDGLLLETNGGNIVQDNFVGTDALGGAALANAGAGVDVIGSPNNTVGGTTSGAGNVISGNAGSGVSLLYAGSTGNVIQGNLIGTDATGTHPIANLLDGVELSNAPANLVGGATDAARNIISGNKAAGIDMSLAQATANVVDGNYIGTDVTGELSLGNGGTGVNLFDTAGNTIGGTGNLISGNGGYGIELSGESSGNLIEGNLIGTSVTGAGRLGNGLDGAAILDSPNNTIGGTASAAANVISGNNGSGLDLNLGGSTGNLVEGNFIGTNSEGTAPLGNANYGVYVNGPNNTIGGATDGSRNIISGNSFEGVMVFGDTAVGNLVAGNYIGTNATGTAAVANGTDTANAHGGLVIRANASANTVLDNVISGNVDVGVSVDNGSFQNTIMGNLIGPDATGEKALGNHGGLIIQAAAHDNVVKQNVISGNSFVGVNVVGPVTVTNNLIVGNLIGTDATGRVALGNEGDGVSIFEPNNTLGGTTATDRNVISGNTGNGVGLYPYSGFPTNELITGNYIGTDITGTKPLGNDLNGIIITGGASSNQIGDTTGGGNTIAFNHAGGIVVRDNSSVDDSIRGNSIFANGDIGIDLNGDGVTPNHPGTAAGPNGLQNYPTISAVQVTPGSIEVTGTLNSLPNTSYSVDFYANLIAGVAGAAPGQTYLGSAQVLTDSQGNGGFDVKLAASKANGGVITCTATDPAGDTSEFSLGAAVNQLPRGGPLRLNTPTAGFLASADQVDRWKFFGRAKQLVALVANTGIVGFPAPIQPSLNYAQIQLVDPSGKVVATGSNTEAGADATLLGLQLPVDGVYTVLVQPGPSTPPSTGYYLISAWDATVRSNLLAVGQTQNGQLNSPFVMEHWDFAAVANEQISFSLLASSNPGIRFDLTGPNNYTAFSGLTGSLGLLTLPAAGNYVLTAHWAQPIAGETGSYAFRVDETTQTPLTLGTPYKGALAGDGQAQLFVLTLATTTALNVSLTDANASDENEVYVSFGSPPSRDSYQYRNSATGANQTLALAGRAGTYFILVYNNLVTSPGATYTLLVQGSAFALTGLTPSQIGNTEAATLLVSGVFPLAYQSSTAYQVQFVAAAGATYPAAPLYLAPTSLGISAGGSQNVDGSMTMQATLPADAVPAGSYSITIADGFGDTRTLTDALTVTAGGTGILKSSMSIPNPIGYHQASILYVQYSNVGTAPMAAPLLVMTATQNGQEGAFLSMDPSLAGLGYVSDTNPAGFNQTVQFLASGAVPGILEPGESMTMPVYYAGWLHTQWDFSRPPIIFNLGELDATSTQTIDWGSIGPGLRPGSINQSAWNAIFPTLTTQLGATWGQYVQVLDNDAVYLAGIGEPTNDLNQLLSFEIEKANAAYTVQTLVSVTADSLPAPGMNLTFIQTFQQSISGRYTQGILGYGWTTNWDISATTMSNGDVVVQDAGISEYFSLQPNGSLKAQAGGQGATLTAAGGAYALTQPDGTVYEFNADGTLRYAEDLHGNRITAGYNAQGQLSSLTHSNGEYLSLSYDAYGHLLTLTDSTGRTGTYGYDAAGQFLTSYTDEYGKTNYAYLAGQSPAQNNALSEVTYADGTHVYFGYDPSGRLDDQHRDGGDDDQKWTYLSPGGYVATDADGNETTVYFNLFGSAAETIDPLANITRSYYDANLNVTKVIGPGGATDAYSYDTNDNLTSQTDPLGLTTHFTYDAHNNLTDCTDAKGNTNSYAYTAQNDLFSITYANGTEQTYSYFPLGEAKQYLNARGQAIGYTYNPQGLVATENFTDGSTFSYEYSPQGNLISATDAQGKVIAFRYGDSNNPDLLTEVDYADGTWLKFEHNVIGQRTKSVDQTGFTVNYAYDSLGRLSNLTDGSGTLIVQYTYDAAGYLIQKDMGNGTRTRYTYDGDGRVRSITNYLPDHRNVNSLDDYTYDALGNVLTDTDQDGEWAYSYDADSELIHAVFTPNQSNPDGLSSQDLQYVYDAAGNRISEMVNGVTTTYESNSVNEYTTSTTAGVTTTYQYDADGNLISQGTASNTTNYAFNELSQLTGMTGPGISANYGYDPLGNRVSQAVNGVTRHFQIDPAGLGNVVAALDGSGNMEVHYTYALGLASQVNAAGAAANYDFNNVGSTVGITGSGGNYVNKYAYLPFGQTTVITATLADPFTFAGQLGVTQDGTGLFCMRVRDYVPAAGRFSGSDPSTLASGDVNLRRYAGNNPTRFVDPWGLRAWTLNQSTGELTESLPNGVYGPPQQFQGYSGYGTGLNNPNHQSWGTDNGIGDGVNVGPIPQGYWKVGEETTFVGASGHTHSGFPLTPEQGTETFGRSGFLLHSDFGSSNSSSGCPVFPPDVWENTVKRGDIIHVIPGTPPATQSDSGDTTAVASTDPNSLIGPTGYGARNFVTGTSLLPYQINFENDPTATAPAQRVAISDPLDPNLDSSTFQLAAVGFGNTYIAIPAGLQHYNITVNTTDNGQSFQVAISLNLNPATGVFTASLQLIDPTTELPPASVLTGFLAPEDGTGRGIGYVGFTISPKASLATGTQIRNVANISFDYAPNIATDQVDDRDPTKGIDPNKEALVTIDSTAPSSSVNPLPATTIATSFPVSWSGSDGAGSGIASYDIYVSEDGGPFTPLLTGTTATSTTFSGAFGHSYAFYSQATDNVGFVQAKSTTAQATTRVVVASPPPLVTMTDASTNVNKKHQVTQVFVTFSGAVNTREADSVNTYRLTAAGKKGSFTGKNAAVIKLKSATYNTASETVTLTPKKPFAVTKPVQLLVYGTGAAALQDIEGRPIDGDHNGQPGGNAVSVISRGGVHLNAVSHQFVSARALQRRLLEPSAVDRVLERENAIAAKHAARAERPRRHEATPTFERGVRRDDDEPVARPAQIRVEWKPALPPSAEWVAPAADRFAGVPDGTPSAAGRAGCQSCALPSPGRRSDGSAERRKRNRAL
jgi:RHS repeat-associated protein